MTTRKMLIVALFTVLWTAQATAHPVPDCQSEHDAMIEVANNHLSARKTVLDKMDLLGDVLRSYREQDRSIPLFEYQSMASDTLDGSHDADRFGMAAFTAATRYILCLRGRP
ncbi:MAG: hypothetical protein OXI01_04565 [Albidovulum sp.]|nr:hypothetical protein [Albidovulum sp.]